MCQCDCDLEWPSHLPYKVWLCKLCSYNRHEYGVAQARYDNGKMQFDAHVKHGRPGS